jgi:hypothetical protein
MSIYTTTEGGGLFVSGGDCHGTPATGSPVLPLATAPPHVYI